MKILIQPIAVFLIVLGLLALTSCQQFEDRGIGIEFGVRLEDRKIWLGAGLKKSEQLAEREVLEGEPPYQITKISGK